MTAVRRAVARVAAILLMVGLSRPTDAQSTCSSAGPCSVAVSLRVGLPHVASLSLSSNTTTIPGLTAADLGTGFRDVVGPTVTVKANAAYRLTIQSVQPSWSYSGAAPDPSKPSSDLLWSRSVSGAFTSSAASATLWPATGLGASATSGQPVSLFYRTLWSWTTSPPGSYTIAVNLTLTSP